MIAPLLPPKIVQNDGASDRFNLGEKTAESKITDDELVPLLDLGERYNFTSVGEMRQEFFHLYGGEAASMDIFQRGLRAYGDINSTAKQLLLCAANSEPFVLSFAGYSVTVGRGNYYQQSYPFVLK